MGNDPAHGGGRPDPVVGRVGSSDHGDIVAGARRAPYAPLRALALFGHDVAGDVLADRVARDLDRAGVHLVARVGDQVVGSVSALPVPDLTEVFDVPIHEVGPILTDGEGADATPRRAVAAALLGALREELAHDGPAMLLLRLEADDHEAVLAAEETGFRLRETTMTFVNDLARRDRNPPFTVRDTVRVHRFGTDPDLSDDFVRSIERDAAPVTLDHYHADPRLPDSACDALYDRVLGRVLRGVGSDVLVMRFEGDAVVGFGSWREWDELAPYGVSMVGSSYGLRLQGAPLGRLFEVGDHVCNETLTGNRLLEWSTQAINYPMVNMLCRAPSIRLCRTSQVFHCWTDAG